MQYGLPTGDFELMYDLHFSLGDNGAREIDGAHIYTEMDFYVPGSIVDMVFFAQNESSDAEWIDSIAMDFPEGVVVNSSTDFVVVTATSHYLESEGQTGDGVVVSWWNWNGGYGNIYSTELAACTVNVSISPDFTGEMVIDYFISGDDFGAEPHEVTGAVILSQPRRCWFSSNRPLV